MSFSSSTSSSPSTLGAKAHPHLHFNSHIEDIQGVAQYHIKNDRPDSAHCRHCWGSMLYRAVAKGRLQEVESLCKPSAVLGTAYEVRKLSAATTSVALGMKDCPAMSQLLVRHLLAHPRGEWKMWDTTEGPLVRSALYESCEDVVLLLLRSCSSECRDAQTGKAFVLACAWALPRVVRALLLPPSAETGEQQTRHEEPEERTQALPIFDPWFFRTGVE